MRRCRTPPVRSRAAILARLDVSCTCAAPPAVLVSMAGRAGLFASVGAWRPLPAPNGHGSSSRQQPPAAASSSQQQPPPPAPHHYRTITSAAYAASRHHRPRCRHPCHDRPHRRPRHRHHSRRRSTPPPSPPPPSTRASREWTARHSTSCSVMPLLCDAFAASPPTVCSR